MSEQLWEQGDCYRLNAWWPNAALDPLTEYCLTKDEGIRRVTELARLDKYSIIHLLTPSGLEVIKMWGQQAGLP